MRGIESNFVAIPHNLTRQPLVKGSVLDIGHSAEGKGAIVTARFGHDGITICDPNRAGEGAAKVFQKIYEKPI